MKNEWLECDNLAAVMLDFLRETGRASERKRGLFRRSSLRADGCGPC